MPSHEYVERQSDALPDEKPAPKRPHTRPEYPGLAIWGAREVSDRLGISRAQIYRMLGELPPRVQLSQARFGWRAADIERWVDDRAERPA